MASTVYRVTDLVKAYGTGTQPANDHVSLEVYRGEFFGILGENGAGKSTLVRQMMNLLRPTSGTIELFGRALDSRATLQVGYMPQHAEALNRLTVEQALYYTAHLRGLSHSAALADADTQIDRWNLSPIRRQDNATLSGGERRLLRLAVAVAGGPDVVILDEPTSDLDPIRRRLVWERLTELNRSSGTTIVFITHDAIEAEKVVHRVAIMHHGRIVAMGPAPELKQAAGLSLLRIEIRFPPSHPPRVTARQRDRIQDDRAILYREWRETAELFARLEPEHIDDLRVTTPTLEDVFIHHADEPPPAALRDSVR